MRPASEAAKVSNQLTDLSPVESAIEHSITVYYEL